MYSNTKAIVFDVYGTLFDVHSVIEECEIHFPQKGEEISKVWRQKQLEYSFLRGLMGNYRPFWSITKDALKYACKSEGVELSDSIEKALLSAYLQLKPYPEVEEVLERLSGFQLAVFSNGSEDMLHPLIEHNRLQSHFSNLISVNGIKRFKPHPDSYLYALEQLGVERHEVLFLSSNTWDIAGAKTFGFQVAWVNRTGGVMDELGVVPHHVLQDLTELID
ncbi:haloacid dehalogenase type II [Bacillus sp. Marseille-Q3570]|uniref:haloacid dehalogenase type II n=1 Tax=Bacillus sp. Marseille-Q3570 TaxID=2963522 RepID=UPI0021B6E78C|nr:haloacid dehalogenase type II [Bacillus sp. Marseille-Q3570]